MIRIRFSDLQYPDGWSDRRKAAEEAIEACTNKAARRRLLNGYLSEVWKDLRDYMARVSHDKCWYCETLLIRDDLIVDHYRPKGRIFEEGPDSEGYWWLAFRANNFRLACKLCNELRDDRIGGTRGGKATHFPLLSGSVRATSETRDLSKEYPVILDPLVRADVECLTFVADAKAAPRYAENYDPDLFYRANESIEILHLNHGRLRRGRGQIYSQVEEQIERCDLAYRRYLDRLPSTADPLIVAESRQAYIDAIQRLDDFLRESSDYSAAAKAIVRQARGTKGREWVEELLLSVNPGVSLPSCLSRFSGEFQHVGTFGMFSTAAAFVGGQIPIGINFFLKSQ